MEVKIISVESITRKKIKLTKPMKKYEIATILITLFPQLRDNSFPNEYRFVTGNKEMVDDNDQVIINSDEHTIKIFKIV